MIEVIKIISKDNNPPQKSKPWKCLVCNETTWWKTKKEASAYKPVFLLGPDWGI
jgi:hypothetical protein